MSFIDTLDQTIIMAGNNLKTFDQNETVSDIENKKVGTEGINGADKREAKQAVRDSSEANAYNDYLNSLSDSELKNICIIALFGKGDGQNFNHISEIVSNKSRTWFLHELSMNTQYLKRGKKLIEENKIDLSLL